MSNEGERMARREVSGFLHLNLESADVPTHEASHLRVSCFGNKCFLNLDRRQDTYSLTLTSEGGALCEVMNQILDHAFSPPR